MLRSKTIMSKEFPKLGGLPDDVREEMLKKENDGAFLFAPAERFEKESSYRCLRCGAHGKAKLALPVCPDCGNSDARTFRKGNSGERGETEIRLVTEKTNVLPIGSMITVRFASEGGRETVAVIVGHLSLRKDRQCFYDYVCVEYPKGYENGVFYINHDDIANVISTPDDVGNKHERWLERKYAEYKVYYSDYHPELRPDPEKVRMSSKIADLMYLRNKKIHIIKRIVCAIAGIAGAASIAFVTKSWEAACGAVLFYVVGMVSEI